jgi:formate C-acetyltransferase
MKLYLSEDNKILKEKMLNEERFVSIEQALIITKTYKENENKPRIIQRALSFKNACEQLEISIEPEELIVGNRSKGVRSGIVFPEAGGSWIKDELENLPNRPQDKFNVHPEDIKTYNEIIYPYWKDKTMEYLLNQEYGTEINIISKVAKINQKDHAQGHITPDVEKWLRLGPVGIKDEVINTNIKSDYHTATIIVLDAAISFMKRYHDLLITEAHLHPKYKDRMIAVAKNCLNLSKRPAQGFHEALQSVWFLFTLLHLESNASSFSPGRADKYLYPYYLESIKKGMSKQQSLDIIESLWLKFNQIVYLRNKNSAKYFAGFPIGFNIAIGGVDEHGNNYENDLSYLFLEAQFHLGLPQPNLSVRLNQNISDKLLNKAIKVVSKGSGMPQFFNDKSIIPALKELGISNQDANNYCIVGCVELTTHGNNLGWSDAAMFNLNKALELTINHGIDMLTNKKIGLDFGGLDTYNSYQDLEESYKKQISYFIEKMIPACEMVEKFHIECLPSPFLSSVINDCIINGKDVTTGGANYNLSGIQMIQVANLADSLASLKKLIYQDKRYTGKEVLVSLQNNFSDKSMQAFMNNKVPKYGNDVDWVDDIGKKWANYFRNELDKYINYRGGKYHTGMYTVSAHVPMGENVGASPDGRNAGEPLADGGLSPTYGKDITGPTAVLNSVSKLQNRLTTNGGLLNMKFLPEFFKDENSINKFNLFMRTFIDLEIPHIQFNVVNKDDLLKAKLHPELYRSLTIRVAGYTAYFVELATELQDEIIARTAYGNI